MQLSKKTSRIVLAILIIASLALSFFYIVRAVLLSGFFQSLELMF